MLNLMTKVGEISADLGRADGKAILNSICEAGYKLLQTDTKNVYIIVKPLGEKVGDKDDK